MKPFQPFVMERMMSRYEKGVEFNLSESGVHPISLRELFADDPDRLQKILGLELDYAHANGIPELRENIARLYKGAVPANVLVTVGAIEANHITLSTLMSPEDEIIVMLPNYMQIWGIARNRGYRMKTFNLVEENGWAPDLDLLESLISSRTRLIAVCNPDNPTGRILSRSEMEGIISCARRSDAWILADEVYRGADRVAEEENPSFFGLYDKVIAVGSMSKAYGLPGLRLGWAVGPEDMIDKIWARHEYMTLSATMLSNHLAAYALSPEMRPRLLKRARHFIRTGFPILDDWLKSREAMFQLRPPDAAAIAFVRYRLDMNSTEFAEALRKEKSVLIVPGDHFGMDRFLRISFGLPEAYLAAALQRIGEFIRRLEG